MKSRSPVPGTISARVLFASDRTCCVCRRPGKAVQLHHLDENPINHLAENLAVLCLECHNLTQQMGGFGKRLDAEQIILYRDDWHRILERKRAEVAIAPPGETPVADLATEASILEIYRERKEYDLLAMHYDAIGNQPLRDKYVELAIQQHPDDAAFLRGDLQKRPDLIPPAEVERKLAALAGDPSWNQRARLLADLGRPLEAVRDHVKGIAGSIEDDNVFGAAYYLKELTESGLVDALFREAQKRAAAEGDLWWQARALEELGATDELNALLLANAQQVEASGNPLLQMSLATARGDRRLYAELRIEMAKTIRMGEATTPTPKRM